MARLKIAFVVTGGLHPSGRVEVMPVLLGLLEALAKHHEVHAFVVRHLAEATSYDLRGFHVHDLGRPGEGRLFSRVWQWRALTRAMRAHGPFDVVHGWWVDPGGLLAAIAGRRFGIPSVVTCDSGEFTSIPAIKYGLQRTLKGRVLVLAACRLATRVHVTSKYMESLAHSHGWSPIQIPIGIDLKRVTAPGGLPAVARESHQGAKAGPPWRVIQVASLNRVKDQYTLLDALAILRREMDVRLDLVGEDTLDGDVHVHTGNVGMLEHVTFHGYVPPDQLALLLHSAHVYVQSSQHEAAGISVLEAAAAGLPIVGTAVGYVADWSPEGAVAVEPNNPEALASAIASSLADPNHRQQLAGRANALARRHDVEWSADAVARLYRELAGVAGHSIY